MFSIIYSLLPFVFIPIHIILLKKRESIGFYIKKGKICYNCKEDLNLPESLLMERLWDDKNHSKLCTHCLRDIKIKSINNSLFHLKYKFQRYIVSDNSNKLILYFTGLVFLLISIDIILKINDINIPMFIVYGTLNIIWWIYQTYKTIYTTKKKTSEI